LDKTSNKIKKFIAENIITGITIGEKFFKKILFVNFSSKKFIKIQKIHKIINQEQIKIPSKKLLEILVILILCYQYNKN